MSSSLHLQTSPLEIVSFSDWKMQLEKYPSATELTRHKMGMLERHLRDSSFNVHRLSPFVVSVINKKDVSDLSLKGITQTDNWVEKFFSISKEYPKATFTFSEKDYQNFFLLKKRLFVWFSQFMPSELTFNTIESQSVDPSLCQDLSELSERDSALVRINRAFSSIKFGQKEVLVSAPSKLDKRRLISPLDNTSSSLGSIFYFDGREMFNDSTSLLLLQSIESSNGVSRLDCAKNNEFEERLMAHLDRRLNLFYASTIATCSQIEDFPFCEIDIGTTNYQIGKGNSVVEDKSEENIKEKFDAAHSAIIPNIIIKINPNDVLNYCSSFTDFLIAKQDLLVSIDHLIASFDQKANEDRKIDDLKSLKENIRNLTSMKELERLLRINLDLLPSAKVFIETSQTFIKDIDHLHARFNQQFNDAKKIADLQRLKENIFKSNTKIDLLKSFSVDIVKSLFSKSLVLVESYLGQNLASTVCLPEFFNKFDCKVEDKLRPKAKDILNDLFKRFNSCPNNDKVDLETKKEAMRGFIRGGTRFAKLGNDLSQNELSKLINASKNFNHLFSTYIKEIVENCKKEIKKSKDCIQKIHNINHIIELITSKNLEKEKEGIKHFLEEFNLYIALNRNESKEMKDLASDLSNALAMRIKEETLRFLRPCEQQFLDQIFNFDLIDSIDEIRMKEIYSYIFARFNDIFSQSPFSENINIHDALSIIETESLKEEQPLKKIKDIWVESINLIKIRRYIFWFSEGDYSKEIVIGLFKQYLESQATKTLGKNYIKSEQERISIQKSYLDLAEFYLKKLEKADYLAEVFFSTLRPEQYLDLRSRFAVESCKFNALADQASCVSSFEMAKGLKDSDSNENQVIQIAGQNLLKPYVKLVPVKSEAFVPKLTFLNIPMFFVIERVIDSEQYPNGLKLILDKPEYFKAPLFAQNFKVTLKGHKVELKIGQTIHGIFNV